MKFKKTILITLLLFAVLTISAVSASEDLATDNITSSDESQDVIEQSDDIASNHDEIAKTNDKEIVGDDESGNDTDETDDYGEYEDDIYTVKTGMFAPSVQVKNKANQNFQVYAYNFDMDTMDGVSNHKLIIKVWTGKTAKKYTIKTDKDGIAKFNTKKLSVGTHKVKILCPAGKYNQKATAVSKIVVKKKNPVYAIKIKIKDSDYEVSKSLKYGDLLKSKVSTYYKTVQISTENDKGAHFKIQKVKIYFKNKKTGKIKVIKVYKSKFDPYDCFATTKLIKEYTPYKAKVWVYKYRTHKDAFRW